MGINGPAPNEHYTPGTLLRAAGITGGRAEFWLGTGPAAADTPAGPGDADEFLAANVLRRETVRSLAGREYTSTEFRPEPGTKLPRVGQYLPEFGGIVVSVSEPAAPIEEVESALFGTSFLEGTRPAPIVTVRSSGSGFPAILPGVTSPKREAWGTRDTYNPIEDVRRAARELFEAARDKYGEADSVADAIRDGGEWDRAVEDGRRDSEAKLRSVSGIVAIPPGVEWGVTRGFPRRWEASPPVVLSPGGWDRLPLPPPPPAAPPPCAHVRQERRKIRDARGRPRRGLYCGDCGERLVPPPVEFTPEEFALGLMLVLAAAILAVNYSADVARLLIIGH